MQKAKAYAVEIQAMYRFFNPHINGIPEPMEGQLLETVFEISESGSAANGQSEVSLPASRGLTRPSDQHSVGSTMGQVSERANLTVPLGTFVV